MDNERERFVALVQLFLRTLFDCEKAIRSVTCCPGHIAGGEFILGQYKTRVMILVSDVIFGARTTEDFEKIALEGMRDMNLFIRNPKDEITKRVEAKVLEGKDAKEFVNELLDILKNPSEDPNKPSGRPLDPKWLH